MKKEYKTMLPKWARMTGDNEHFDVRKDISDYFGISYGCIKLADAYQELIEARDAETVYAIKSELLLDSILFDILRKEQGEDVANEVMACL